MKILTTWLLLLTSVAHAGLQICPRMPVTAGSSGQFVSAISASGLVTLSTPAAAVTAQPTIQSFLSGTGTYNKDYTFIISSGSATIGATYTNNAVTFTVYATVSSAVQVVMSGSGAPAASGTLTKASGTGDSTLTFSQVLAPLYLRVRAVGGGGGGAGGSATGGAGGAGGNTTFGSTVVVANGGGGGGTNSGASSAGGTASLGTGAIGMAIQGGTGGTGGNQVSTTTPGGYGAASAFAGSGSGAQPGVAPGNSAIANSGSGGGGGGMSTGNPGGGGSAGGFADALIVGNIAATYAFAVGSAGTAGTAGTGGLGGTGGSGRIEVIEYYQ